MRSLCVLPGRKCIHYGAEECPVIEMLGPTDGFVRETHYTFILYMLRGTVCFSYGTVKDYTLPEGGLMLFPPGIRITGHTDDRAQVLLLRIKDAPALCDKYTFESLYLGRDMGTLRHAHLEGNAIVRAGMELLAENIANGLLCVRFMEIKVQELFFYLRAYYTDDELAGFNQPLLGANARFMVFIWQNYRHVRNVEQFARLSNSPLATFKVKFKKVTGMAPSQWLTGQKVRNVYHEIICGQKSLKEISREYHFASVSHLGSFCRKNFGKTPGNMKPGKDQATK